MSGADGSATARCDQRLWAAGANDNREQENEHGDDILDGGDDDRVDAEPNLGAAENLDQTRWSLGREP